MRDPTHGRPWPLIASVLIAGVLLFWLGYSVLHSAGQQAVEASADAPPYRPSALHPVVIRSPDGAPALQVGVHPQTGAPITASCTTCHNTRAPNPANRATADLDQFHQGLQMTHGRGALSCLSCHNPNDYDSLRAADGSTIQFSQSMTLCAQCHTSQHEDYQHGAHGGMSGYWDLSQGPRTRNTCINCHDPHAPGFPQMLPTFKPIDRGLLPDLLHAQPGEGEGHHE